MILKIEIGRKKSCQRVNKGECEKGDEVMLSCKVGENIINTIEYDNEQIRKWSKKGILKCPVCDGKMIYKNGEFKIAHFAHEKSECSLMYSETETKEHLNGKKALYEWLKAQEGVINLQLEAWIPETKQRPDIYFEYDGERYVIEYQCSPIATKYAERHRLYELAGIKDIWILGTEKYYINENYLNRILSYEYHTKTIEREIITSDEQQYIFFRNNKFIFVADDSIKKISEVVKYAFRYREFLPSEITINDLICNKDICSLILKKEQKILEEQQRIFKEKTINKQIEYVKNHFKSMPNLNSINFTHNNIQFYYKSKKHIVEFIIDENEVYDKLEQYKGTNINYIPFVFVEKDNKIAVLKDKPTTCSYFECVNYILENQVISIKKSTSKSFIAHNPGRSKKRRFCIRHERVYYYHYDYNIKHINDITFDNLSIIENIKYIRKITIIDDFYKKPKHIKKVYLKDFDISYESLVYNLYPKLSKLQENNICLILPKSLDRYGKPIRKSEYELLDIKEQLNEVGYSNVEIYWG